MKRLCTCTIFVALLAGIAYLVWCLAMLSIERLLMVILIVLVRIGALIWDVAESLCSWARRRIRRES